MKKGKQEDGKITAALKKSPINYMSDLFVVVMVAAWIVVLIVMVAAAVYSTVCIQDTSVWSYVGDLTAIPLSAGGAIWMIKNSVQHAIANNRGERAHMDFPAVNAEGQDDGMEPVMDEQEESEGAG
ncbi:MAG: hypothetical protein LUE63_00250 [Lachnospiraceae bacterium]|nr:hypothetical protein [Lachnospiraceae bacterium]